MDFTLRNGSESTLEDFTILFVFRPALPYKQDGFKNFFSFCFAIKFTKREVDENEDARNRPREKERVKDNPLVFSFKAMK